MAGESRLEQDVRQQANSADRFSKLGAIVSGPVAAVVLGAMGFFKPADAGTVFQAAFIAVSFLALFFGAWIAWKVKDLTKYYFEYRDIEDARARTVEQLDAIRRERDAAYTTLSVVDDSLSALVGVVGDIEAQKEHAIAPRQVGVWMRRVFDGFVRHRDTVFGYTARDHHNLVIYVADEKREALRILERWTHPDHPQRNREVTAATAELRLIWTCFSDPPANTAWHIADTWLYEDARLKDLSFRSKLLAPVSVGTNDEPRGVFVVSNPPENTLGSVPAQRTAGICAAIAGIVVGALDRSYGAEELFANCTRAATQETSEP